MKNTTPITNLLPQPFAWIEIPAGSVTLEAGGYVPEGGQTFDVPTFAIAKYPVTNAQFAMFIEAGGYEERQWWTDTGWNAREDGWHLLDGEWQPSGNPWTEPRYWNESGWNGAHHPVVGVSWHEAVAFCLWLSDLTGEPIMLPTAEQWQYAAQGDDGREFPWGDEWDCERCNNSVEPCKSTSTTPVTRYDGQGDSPFGVSDMAGNVWEWSLSDYFYGSTDIHRYLERRWLHGGSFNDADTNDFRAARRYWNFPAYRTNVIGFRLARLK